MTDYSTVGSVELLQSELGALIRAYAAHFDPNAVADLTHLRLELVGPSLSLTYADVVGAPPTLMVTLTLNQKAIGEQKEKKR